MIALRRHVEMGMFETVLNNVMMVIALQTILATTVAL